MTISMNNYFCPRLIFNLHPIENYSKGDYTVISLPQMCADGSVNAPGWVLPAGAALVILTAAVPILLQPGEEALEQQRLDEDVKGGTNFRR